MTHPTDRTAFEDVMELLAEHGPDAMADAFRALLNEAMKAERSAVLGAQPYQRTESRKGHANGFKPKTLRTRMGAVELAIPQARGVEFYPSALEKGARSERALKLAIAEMYVQGVSTRKVSAVLEQLCGLDVTSAQVSRVAAVLDESLEAWRNRPLGPMDYLILDARYEKVRHGGAVVSCAVLIALGITPEGKRSILGVSVSLSEAETHWRTFLLALQSRGLHGVKMIVSDDHAGLGAAREAVFHATPWQRCQFHLMQNAMAYVPQKAMQRDVAAELRGILDAPDRPEADRRLGLAVRKYTPTAPDLARWMEQNLPQGLTVLGLPAAHRRRLRTTNMLERQNKEIKRRTRVAGLFPHEASLLRLVTAVLVETHDEWETERAYLNMETD